MQLRFVVSFSDDEADRNWGRSLALGPSFVWENCPVRLRSVVAFSEDKLPPLIRALKRERTRRHRNLHSGVVKAARVASRQLSAKLLVVLPHALKSAGISITSRSFAESKSEQTGSSFRPI